MISKAEISRRDVFAKIMAMQDEARPQNEKDLQAVLTKHGFSRESIASANWLASLYNSRYSRVVGQGRMAGMTTVRENYKIEGGAKQPTHYISLISHPWQVEDKTADEILKIKLPTLIYLKEVFIAEASDFNSTGIVEAPVKEFLEAMKEKGANPVDFFSKKLEEASARFKKLAQEGEEAYAAFIEQLTSQNFSAGNIGVREFRKLLFGDANFASALDGKTTIYSRSTASETIHISVGLPKGEKTKFPDRVSIQTVWLNGSSTEPKFTAQLNLGEFIKGKPDVHDEPHLSFNSREDIAEIRRLQKTIGKFQARAANPSDRRGRSRSLNM
jgi:hypothetical protein